MRNKPPVFAPSHLAGGDAAALLTTIVTVAALVLSCVIWGCLKRKVAPSALDGGGGEAAPRGIAAANSKPGRLEVQTKRPLVSIFVDELFDKPLPMLLQQRVIPDLPEGLSSLSEKAALILISKADSDEEAEAVIEYFKQVMPEIPSHRVLVCSQDSSRVSIARQLQPLIHLDSNSTVWKELSDKVANSLLLQCGETVREEARTLEECNELLRCLAAGV